MGSHNHKVLCWAYCFLCCMLYVAGHESYHVFRCQPCILSTPTTHSTLHSVMTRHCLHYLSVLRSLAHWFDLNVLSMNPDKTDAIVVACTNARQRADSTTSRLQVDLQTVDIKLAASVRSLGATIDSALSFNEHVEGICKSSYRLRALCHIHRNHINEDTANNIACSVIHGRLDYCNSVLCGTSSVNLNKLQRVQNSFARIVRRTKRSEHITPIPAELHWLPVKYRIDHAYAR